MPLTNMVKSSFMFFNILNLRSSNIIYDGLQSSTVAMAGPRIVHVLNSVHCTVHIHSYPVAVPYGGEGGGRPPLTAVLYVWRPCAPSGEYTCIFVKIKQKLYIGKSLAATI